MLHAVHHVILGLGIGYEHAKLRTLQHRIKITRGVLRTRGF